MKLIFPFRNIVINTLWGFFEREKVKEFNDFKFGKDTWREEYFKGAIERWKDQLPNFENEILQVINTTDQKTIDEYFNGLGSQLNQLSECLTEEFFIENISLWNDEILKRYTEAVEKEGEEYAKQENRKRKHLEEYEDWDYGILLRGFNKKAEKVKRINYNYYCIQKLPDLIDEKVADEYLPIVSDLFDELINASKKYGVPWQNGEIKSQIEKQFIPKPIVFVEGDHDITLISKAAEHLGKTDLLKMIELRQRGGYRNLDKLWTILKEESWETVPQTKVFLYDCDTNKENEDFGNHYKRIIPTNPSSIVKKGIENLFSNEVVAKAIFHKKAFVDFKKIEGTKRGIDYTEEQNEINKHEKKNFCDWICEDGTKADFEPFKIIFDIIEDII